jgi:glycosyltransferase involved in cell wall biosynthesis
MTRLCIVTLHHSRPVVGGAEQQIEYLLDALVETRWHDIYFLAHVIGTDTGSHGYQVVRIGRGRQVDRFGYWLDAIPLYRALRAIRPEVIYQRVGGGYTGIAAYYARKNGARLIWHVAHDTDVTPGNSLLYGNVLKSFTERRCIEYGIRHADSIVVQTECQAEHLAHYYSRKADAIVPNFHPEPSETLDKRGAPLVVWVANLKPWKQPEVFVRLAARLSNLAGVRFTMVGAMQGGPKAWREQLQRDIHKTTNLDYIGRKTQREVNELLARAHLLVNTSVQEGYPNTFIQAWQREVPVVSLTVNPDGVLDRQGVGICAGSEQRLEECVQALLENSALRTQYAARAHDFAARHHSLRNTQALVRLIETGEVDAANVPSAAAIADLRSTSPMQ